MEPSTTRPREDRRAWRVLRYSAPVGVTLLWVSVLLAPPSLKPLVAVVVGIVTGGLALFTLAFTSVTLSATARHVAMAFGLGLVALLVGVFAHPVPIVSIVGVVGQHNGWLLWATAAVWFMVGARLGRGMPFRVMVWSVAVLGALAGVFALLDAAHLVETVRWSPEVAGLMDSSISLGQVLLVGLGASTALVAMEQSSGKRFVAGAMTFVQLPALFVSSARAAEIALICAALVGILWMFGDRITPHLKRALWGVTGLVVVAAILAIGVIAWLGPAGSGTLAGLLTDRPTIWHSAFSRVLSHLLVGEGPDRFTSIVTWAPMSDAVTWETTNSPHNVLFDWLLGGGVVALFAFVAAVVLAGMGIARRLASAGAGPKLFALGVGAWVLTLLTSWTDPLTACIAALVIGSLLSEQGEPTRPTVANIAPAAVVLLAAGVVLVLVTPLFELEQGWAADQRSRSTNRTVLETRWERWPDPAFGGEVLRASLIGLPASATEAGRVASEVLDRTPWDTNGAMMSLEVAVGVGRFAPSTPRPTIDRALAVGRTADPTSGIWDRAESIVKGK